MLFQVRSVAFFGRIAAASSMVKIRTGPFTPLPLDYRDIENVSNINIEKKSILSILQQLNCYILFEIPTTVYKLNYVFTYFVSSLYFRFTLLTFIRVFWLSSAVTLNHS